jgi:catechol 2,3-dioxygenase-like lactoylglutathione lyase family enzyme
MAELPESDRGLATEQTPLDLFMTVVQVTNWPMIVKWYTDTLGLVPIVLDGEHEFALLEAGSGRLGLKGVKAAHAAHERIKIRLVFQVADVDVERARLVERGVVVSPVFDNREEGYREVRLHDPDGNSLTIFAWADAAASSRLPLHHR